MPFLVQDLIDGRRPPVSIPPEETIQQALARMIEHGYSQLPVAGADARALGMITSDSILRAVSNFGVGLADLRAKDALERGRTYRADDDLFDLLDDLRDRSAVLIVERDETLRGIVTNYDAMEYFRRRAEDTMVVRDIESMIKRAILASFTADDGQFDEDGLREAVGEITPSNHALKGKFARALKTYMELGGQERVTIDGMHLQHAFESCLYELPAAKDFERLSLDEYRQLFLQENRWQAYGGVFGVGRGALDRLLQGVRDTRNSLAHLRENISSQQQDQLQFCKDWLARHQMPPHAVVAEVVSSAAAPPLQVADLIPRPASASTGMFDPGGQGSAPRDSYYDDMGAWLQARVPAQPRISATLGELDAALDGGLSPSARKHEAWWNNDERESQAQQWLLAGWRVASVDIAAQKVTFARIPERERRHAAFFNALLRDLAPTGLPILDARPQGSSWITLISLGEEDALRANISFSFVGEDRCRLELVLDVAEGPGSTAWQALERRRTALERALDLEVGWEAVKPDRGLRIALYRAGGIMGGEEQLLSIREWVVQTLPSFYKAVTGWLSPTPPDGTFPAVQAAGSQPGARAG